MHIAVVVVSYNTVELLRNCLSSIFASFALGITEAGSTAAGATASGATSEDELTVIVVDNASSDGSPEMVAAEFPRVMLLAQTENIGFVAGNNLALEKLGFSLKSTDSRRPIADDQRPTVVLLLNPDAELIDNALWQMARFLVDTPSAGACGAHLNYGDGVFQHGAFRFPSLAQVLIDFFPLTGLPGVHRIHNSKLNGRYPQLLWSSHQPFDVDFVLGAAMMVNGDAIVEIGGLDPEYVMYCEEMDWCLRIKESGRQVYAVPTARVVHHEAQSSKQRRWESYVQLWRSRFRFYQKHRSLYPRGYTLLLRLALKWGLWWRKRQASGQFARGNVTGRELAAELSAYDSVGRL